MGHLRLLLLLAAVLALQACTTTARHPAVAAAQASGQLPPLLPVRRFVANIDFAGGYQLSPDGQWLLWTQTVGTDAGLAVRPVTAGVSSTFATGYLARPDGVTYTWLPDSRHVAYLKDLSGDENTQLHVFDSTQPFSPWAVTPWPGVRSRFVAAGPRGSAKFYFASNHRDRATLDLYEADAATRSIREVARSDGLVLGWVVGVDRQLAGRVRQLGPRDGSGVALEVAEPGDRWRQVRVAGGFDQLWIHRLDASAQRAWGSSNIGRDKLALVEIDLASGAERVLATHPVVDVGSAYYPPLGGGPQVWLSDAGLPAAHWLDSALGAEVQAAVTKARTARMLDAEPHMARPQSQSEDGRRMVLRTSGDFDVAELLLDRDTGAVTRLDPKTPEAAALLAAERPYSFRASDGREIHGYVIRPRGVTGPAPLVVQIHGGPWARDHWRSAGFNTDQLLANRGYAVLTVNYRGSSGYGRDFMDAARREMYHRVQRDIAEATQWAIDRKIADPQRMAVLGGSFGGFSVMAQLIHQHHDWRCGVNVVGVANWPRAIESFPPFWRSRHFWDAFFGDVTRPEERARMLAQSPISHIDRITAPMLVIHGANDVRVLRQDSDDVVAALRKLGRPVEYLSFPNEGHSVRRWRNRLEMWRRIEDTLADCLGGRSAGWDYYQLMPR